MIHLPIHTQPDDVTCGPTTLHAVYQFYGYSCQLPTLISEIPRSASGGTLAPFLGQHALKNNFEAVLYIYDLNLFDPTWFGQDDAPAEHLIHKLREQRRKQRNRATLIASEAYETFLELGGIIRFETIKVSLLKKFFTEQRPIITGLSSTYLYRCARERYNRQGQAIVDDIHGKPCGHFVVLCGYDDKKRLVVVADPHQENSMSHDNYYKVPINRLINAILLGVFTFDANLLIIQPKEKRSCKQ